MTQQITVTEQAQAPEIHPIALDFLEGQDVILLRGAQIGGLTTRTNQPGTVVKVLYSDEFGFTYCVAFGTMQRMYAYVSAEGLEAVAEVAPEVTPLLDLYPGVDAGDTLPALLEDVTEFIEVRDAVAVNLPGAQMPYYGRIIEINVSVQYALVDCNDGAQRWASIDELQLILKAGALESETPSFEFEGVS